MGRSEGLTPPLIRPAAWRAGAVVAAAGALVMLLLVATSGAGDLFRSDALYFRLVAENPFGHHHLLFEHRALTGDAYRYGRMLYPLVAWVLALGHGPWVRWSLPVVDIAALGCVVALAWELMARAGEPANRALAVLLVPGLWLSVSIAFSEVFVLALILLLYLVVIDARRVAPFVVVAVALLARETVAIAAVPLVLRALQRRNWRDLPAWALTAVPLVLWWAWVRHRVGEWPPFDRSLSRREALSAPFMGAVRVVHEGTDSGHWITFALGIVTVVAAVWVFTRAPWYPMTGGALAFAALIVCLGPNALRYPGEAIRLMTPAQALVVLAVARARGHERTVPAPREPA